MDVVVWDAVPVQVALVLIAFGTVDPHMGRAAVREVEDRRFGVVNVQPEFSDKFTRVGLEMVGGTPEAFGKTISDDVTFWGRMVETLGLTKK